MPVAAAAVGPEPAPRRFGWPHVAVAVLVGAILGAAVPSAIGAATRPSDDARATSLHALASAYLQAIADGDAERATELAPLELGREAAPAPVLAAAWRIRPVAVAEPLVDGGEGSVGVRYRVGGTDVDRTLRATLTAAGWRLTTSLAEPPDVGSNEPPVELRVAGVDLPVGGAMHLYPAVYRLDVVEGPLFASGGDAFVIDGDPATTTVVEAESRLTPSFEELLIDLAVASVDACRAAPGCQVRTSAPFAQAAPAAVLGSSDGGRAIDVQLPLVARDDAGWEWRDVTVRVTLDSRGMPVDWQCSTPGRAELAPCPP